jgi:hypothetical protein
VSLLDVCAGCPLSWNLMSVGMGRNWNRNRRHTHRARRKAPPLSATSSDRVNHGGPWFPIAELNRTSPSAVISRRVWNLSISTRCA